VRAEEDDEDVPGTPAATGAVILPIFVVVGAC